MKSLFVLFAFVPQICLAQEVGDSVMPKVDVDIFASGKKVLDYSTPLVVKQIEDEWLDVGHGWIKKKNVVPLTDAEAYYTNFLDANPKNSEAFYLRGLYWIHQENFQSAVKDFDESIRLDPNDAIAHNRRGMLLSELHEYKKSINDFRAAIELNDEYYRAHNNLAWALATCPDESLLDGSKAVEHATRACERTAWHNDIYLTTLAAAHAENGNFDKAIEQLNKAIELKPEKLKALREEMLDHFKQDKPYRTKQD